MGRKSWTTSAELSNRGTMSASRIDATKHATKTEQGKLTSTCQARNSALTFLLSPRVIPTNLPERLSLWLILSGTFFYKLVLFSRHAYSRGNTKVLQPSCFIERFGIAQGASPSLITIFGGFIFHVAWVVDERLPVV
ncbi:hypothetical protein F4679DRAFT_383324 [Xylaria curta]|nr:hypothetical protein F4679DRAFT_383324 [Xylaria curta]